MQESYNSLERRRKTILKKISQLGPMIMGTPMYTRNKSTVSGKREETFKEKMYLTWTEKGSTSGSVYVPIGLREEAVEWVENYRLMKKYMEEMTELSRRMIRLYSKTKGLQAKKRIQKRTQTPKKKKKKI